MSVYTRGFDLLVIESYVDVGERNCQVGPT